MNHRKVKHELKLRRLDRLLVTLTTDSGRAAAGYVRMFVNLTVHKRLKRSCIGKYAKENAYKAYPDIFGEFVSSLNHYEMAEYFGRRIQLDAGSRTHFVEKESQNGRLRCYDGHYSNRIGNIYC